MSSAIFSLTYDTIDDHKLPREGLFVKGAAEFAGLGGDADYLKLTGAGGLLPSADRVGRRHRAVVAGGGHLLKTNGNVDVFDQFFLGGETIRGFDVRGLGPRALCTSGAACNTGHSYNDPLGGTTYLNATAEVNFPMPVIPEDIGIRGAVFADAGTLYGSAIDTHGDTVVGDSMQWRASVGASIIWASPFGPLRFDYAFPIAKESFDDVQHFRFGASTRF